MAKLIKKSFSYIRNFRVLTLLAPQSITFGGIGPDSKGRRLESLLSMGCAGGMHAEQACLRCGLGGLDVEAEVHYVAVLDYVFFAFD